MFKECYCEETGILQKESRSFFKAFDPRGVPQERSNLATYGNHDVKTFVEHFINNYLKEEEETSIIAQWPAMSTRPVRQKNYKPK